jgi:hypothetical protein
MAHPEAALNHQVAASVDHTLDLSTTSMVHLGSQDLTSPWTMI